MLNKSKYRETNRGMRTEAESGKVRIDKERFFNLPVVILTASSFMLGMSEFIVVGILPDIAARHAARLGAVGTVPAIRHSSDADRHIPCR